MSKSTSVLPSDANEAGPCVGDPTPPIVLAVVGTRSQLMKAAAVSRYLATFHDVPPFHQVLVHAGAASVVDDEEMLLDAGHLPSPTRQIDVAPGSPGAMLAAHVDGILSTICSTRAAAVLAYGDSTATLAAGLASGCAGIPFVHAEAGERVFRRYRVPEEVNRVLADHVAALCLTSTRRATANLLREGMSRRRVRFVGDPTYDRFLQAQDALGQPGVLRPEALGLTPGGYHLASIHRLENVADRAMLVALLDELDRADLPVLFPLHKNVETALAECGWVPRGSLRLLQPLRYLDFLSLLRGCAKCVTDAGGVSREAFFAGKPCIVPLDSSWWAEVVEAGWALEVGRDPRAVGRALREFTPVNPLPHGLFGDGESGRHIVSAISEFLRAPDPDGVWHRHAPATELPKPAASDFTFDRYRRFLTALKEHGYQFAAFPDAERMLEEGAPFVLLRHDIDFDLALARQMAEIEAELGVRSTFFFLLRTEFYNIFSARGSADIQAILALGHQIGLHFDAALYPDARDARALAAECAREAGILERWFRRKVEIVSYHRPNPRILTGDPALSAPLPHTYMPQFTSAITYLSDSMGIWRHGDPLLSECFAQRRPMQILIHPIWWQERPTGAHEVLMQFVDNRAHQLERDMSRHCKVYRVGWLREGLTE